MNRPLTLLACSLAMATLAVAQFEGVVESRNLTMDEGGSLRQFTITMWIKNDRIKIRTTSVGSTPATTMIYRRDRHITWMLDEDNQTYFEILQHNQPQTHYSAPGAGQAVALKRTGKTRKILGYPCEQVLLRRDAEETEIWGTRALPDLAATTKDVLGESDAESPGGWQEELNALGLFPLVASTRLEGTVVESQETTRIERRENRADLFELPAGFRKQDVGQIGGEQPR